MDAYQTSEVLLSYIKMSNLNFSLVESPFGVTITLKKSFIKNQDGSLRKSGLQTHPSSFQQHFTSPQQLFQNQETFPVPNPNKQSKFQNGDPSMNLAKNSPYSRPTTKCKNSHSYTTKFEKNPTGSLEKTTFPTSNMNRTIPSLTSSHENTTTSSKFEKTPTSSRLEKTTFPTSKMNMTIPSLTSSPRNTTTSSKFEKTPSSRLEKTTFPTSKMNRNRTIPSLISSLENTTTASKFENTPTSRLEKITFSTSNMDRTIPSLPSSLENTTYPTIKMNRTNPSIRQLDVNKTMQDSSFNLEKALNDISKIEERHEMIKKKYGF